MTSITSLVEINSNFNTKTSESGFLGVYSEFQLSDNIDLLIEANYLTKAEIITVPILAEINLVSGLNVLFGTQFNIETHESGDDFSAITFFASGGVSYEIDENFKILTTYSHQLKNSYTGEFDLEIKFNIISFGLIFNMFD